MSRRKPNFVILVRIKRGIDSRIQYVKAVRIFLDPGACPGPDTGFTEVTTFYDFTKLSDSRKVLIPTQTGTLPKQSIFKPVFPLPGHVENRLKGN